LAVLSALASTQPKKKESREKYLIVGDFVAVAVGFRALELGVVRSLRAERTAALGGEAVLSPFRGPTAATEKRV